MILYFAVCMSEYSSPNSHIHINLRPLQYAVGLRTLVFLKSIAWVKVSLRPCQPMSKHSPMQVWKAEMEKLWWSSRSLWSSPTKSRSPQEKTRCFGLMEEIVLLLDITALITGPPLRSTCLLECLLYVKLLKLKKLLLLALHQPGRRVQEFGSLMVFVFFFAWGVFAL